jgi:hypothetical protein
VVKDRGFFLTESEREAKAGSEHINDLFYSLHPPPFCNLVDTKHFKKNIYIVSNEYKFLFIMNDDSGFV